MADSERIGPYRVIQRLGAGGMGEVVLAHDDRLDRLVAIKRLHDNTATPERRERFRREARIVARLNHPAIVQIHDVHHEAGHDYLIMEYVEGRTLRERRDAGPMSVSEILGIAHQIALGMAAAHDLGIIHRDLKAENVLITRSGRAKLTDFGIAKLDGEDTVTARGAVLGTFRAMSPEQALGRPIDHRSDLFSFGILLYEALAGESPFRAETPYLTVQRLVVDEPRPLAELVPSVPAELASLVHQLLAKEPLLRPRDFHEVAAELIALAGRTCDAPCRAGSSHDGLPRSDGDSRATEDSVAPPHAPREPAEAPPMPTPPREPPEVMAMLDPARRPREPAEAPPMLGPANARTVLRGRPWRFAVLGATALGAIGLGYALCGGRVEIVRVAVLAPTVSGADDRPDVALSAAAVRNIIEVNMRAREGLDLIPRGDIEAFIRAPRDTGPPPGQRAIRDAVGADEVVVAHLSCMAGTCMVEIERDTRASGVSSSPRFQLAADGGVLPDETVALHLSRLYPDHPVRDAAHAAPIALADHLRYIQLVQDYWAGSNPPSSDAVLDEVDQIRLRSGSIDVLLFEAELLRHRYLQTGAPEALRRAVALLDEADRDLPRTYSILSARFDLEIAAGHLDAAAALLDRLALLDPDSSTTHLQRAKLHYRRARLRYKPGETDAVRHELDTARAELDDAARRDSFSWHVLYHRALVLRALRDSKATRAALDQLLERSPGNYAGLSLLAQEHLDAGRFACAAQIYAQLVAREPLFQECHSLGYALVQLGRYREAASGFACALRVRPDNPAVQLNRAEALLLAGDVAVAGMQLRDLRDLLARKRRDDPRRALSHSDLVVEAQTLGYLGRDDAAAAQAARADVDKLLAGEPRPIDLYTAALVHAYLGDRDAAARDVTRYLDGHNSAADLGYPWFDELRRDPKLRDKFTASPVAVMCDASAAP